MTFLPTVLLILSCVGSVSLQSEYLFNLIVNMTEGAESLGSLEEQIQQLRAQLSSQSNAAKQLAELQKENDYFRERNERMERELSHTKTSLDETDRSYQKLRRESASFEKSEETRIYVSKEIKRIPKLKRKAITVDDTDVEEWIEDVQNYFDTRHLAEGQKIEFIYEHVDGQVRSELRYRPEQERRSAQSILKIIHDVFGDSESLSALQEMFFKRSQKADETLHEYSLSLMQLHDKIQKRSLETGITSYDDKILKDKFTEGVKDEHLRRELRRLQIDCPSMPFTVFRDRAIKWVGSETSGLKASKAKSCSSVNKTEVEVSGQTGHDSSLLGILKKQQEQLDKMSSMIQGLKQPKYRGRWKDGTNDKGERVCFKCHQPGHLIKDCPQRQNANNAQSSEKPKGLN